MRSLFPGLCFEFLFHRRNIHNNLSVNFRCCAGLNFAVITSATFPTPSSWKLFASAPSVCLTSEQRPSRPSPQFVPMRIVERRAGTTLTPTRVLTQSCTPSRALVVGSASTISTPKRCVPSFPYKFYLFLHAHIFRSLFLYTYPSYPCLALLHNAHMPSLFRAVVCRGCRDYACLGRI